MFAILLTPCSRCKQRGPSRSLRASVQKISWSANFRGRGRRSVNASHMIARPLLRIRSLPLQFLRSKSRRTVSSGEYREIGTTRMIRRGGASARYVQRRKEEFVDANGVPRGPRSRYQIYVQLREHYCREAFVLCSFVTHTEWTRATTEKFENKVVALRITTLSGR